MTIETCKKRLELAKTDKEKEFWTKRIARKIARFPKYTHLRKPEVKDDGKKSKR